MPFVLSWSVLEAMSAGCLVVASKTPPVEEVIAHDRSGLLFHFFSHDELADLVEEALSSTDRYDVIRKTARESVIERFDLRRKALPAQIGMIGAVAGRSVNHRMVAAA